MDLRISGKRALVTGASSGIGRACAVALAQEGVEVCVVGRDPDRLAAVVSEIETGGGKAFSVSVDLSTESGCKSAMNACVEAWGGVDILINCAGAAPRGHILHDLTRQVLNESLELKLYSYLQLSQLAFPYMKSKGWGRIVHIAGAAATEPTVTNFAAGLANIGILNMTRALSDAGARDGILVNAICPGLTNTPRARGTRRAAAERNGRSISDAEIEEDIRQEAESTPAGRPAEPEEIAHVAVFLSSEACSYVHANAIYMDGDARRATP